MNLETKAYDIPVVLFVFRRLDTVKMIIEKLKEVKPQEVYIFSDGARDDREDEQHKVQTVREYLDSAIDWQCHVHKEYASQNKGCAKNICEGINQVFSVEKKAIILEDDAVPMTEFFQYCKILLEKYESNKKIQYIAGFNAVGDTECIKESYSFSYTAPMSGAIATWADRWNECDFTMRTWPNRKRDGSLKKYFFSHELYCQNCNAFEDSYHNVNDGWDYQFHYDMLDKERYAIVPKGNLVRSYGYTEGAFHEQGNRVAKRLIKIMDYTHLLFAFPMDVPKSVVWNQDYDRIRQQKFLEVNGNYLERHCSYLLRGVKDCAYKYMPTKLWNFGKMLIKR